MKTKRLKPVKELSRTSRSNGGSGKKPQRQPRIHAIHRCNEAVEGGIWSLIALVAAEHGSEDWQSDCKGGPFPQRALNCY